MCRAKRYTRNPNNEIDDCISHRLKILNRHGIKTKASCCGHGKYPVTIIIEYHGFNLELISGIIIDRKRKFYKRDEEGFYYIPEVLEEINKDKKINSLEINPRKSKKLLKKNF